MTNRDEANKLASKITGETVNAATTKGALEAISGKKAGSIAQAIDDIVQGNIPGGDVTVEALSVTENGIYTAERGKAYSPVTVNVPTGGDSVTLSCYMITVDGNSQYFYVRADLLESISDGETCTSGKLYMFHDNHFSQYLELNAATVTISNSNGVYYFNSVAESQSVEMIHIDADDFTVD